ncbi:NYN domain-containing protein [Sansalvadorimonas sp. 2012CJ34-2]|uniref:NYN domain-containing protein n=1 Tax=Parendozoicomonas callyspongiae TaxID=2942213 RepID=A0ABT0PHW7_9GAMM|nr:NYN domain-containing protein [Sansalvadorimonas sp. 2012CJ34-2]MCL6270963.1 NYN domain-containing protein [Sansalvadorimonas sp. 2012CJ34-2]
MEKVAVFVDVQNIYYTTRNTYNCNFNYSAFWAEATKGREVVGAFAYAIDRGDEKQRQFQNILKRIGFEVKLKPFIQRSDGSAKGDWDVGITLDVMDYASQVDVIVLASGDGDFDMLLDRASSKHGTSTEVYGVPQLTATSLIHAANRYFPIDASLLMNKQP